MCFLCENEKNTQKHKENSGCTQLMAHTYFNLVWNTVKCNTKLKYPVLIFFNVFISQRKWCQPTNTSLLKSEWRWFTFGWSKGACSDEGRSHLFQSKVNVAQHWLHLWLCSDHSLVQTSNCSCGSALWTGAHGVARLDPDLNPIEHTSTVISDTSYQFVSLSFMIDKIYDKIFFLCVCKFTLNIHVKYHTHFQYRANELFRKPANQNCSESIVSLHWDVCALYLCAMCVQCGWFVCGELEVGVHLVLWAACWFSYRKRLFQQIEIKINTIQLTNYRIWTDNLFIFWAWKVLELRNEI